MSSTHILALNSGASTLKFALYESADEIESPLARGCIERIGIEGGRLWMRTRGGRLALERSRPFANRQAAVEAVFESLEEAQLDQPHAVGHRVAHGGPSAQPQRIDGDLLQSLKRLTPLAPMHLPDELSCIESVSSHNADLPQVACFDTAFFATLPELTRRLPFPASLYEHPAQRYGFQGLSYESIVLVRGIGQAGLTILVHLGQGSSMVALRDGHPVDIHHEAGLLGDWDSSSDMRVVLERRSRDERAALAFEMFCYQTKKAIGALVAALGGVDNLLFTGGIGENAPPVRERICASLGPVGIRLDDARNRSQTPYVISPDDSRCSVQVIDADEELVIARHTRRVLGEKFANP